MSPRKVALAVFLVASFGVGFYLAELYAQISALIDERSGGLASAVYSAPLILEPGDDVAQLRLLDRLNHLSYSRTRKVDAPGEYRQAPGELTIYFRSFELGAQLRPAMLVHLTLSGSIITNLADAFGVARHRAVLEPEVIGRLLAGAPAERVQVALADVPFFLRRGLVATEDRFFYYHFGFDPVRVVEAAIADLRSGHLIEGASTITQQLARTFIGERQRTFGRKIKELAVALVIELRLSKRQILERYINDVAMGEYGATPIYGLPLAARIYFNKELREVTPAESATLIGMIRAPSLYDPRRHPALCVKRRNTVLAVMLRAGIIDRAQYQDAVATPLKVSTPPPLRRAPYFTDYVIRQVEKLPGFDGRLAGLRVYTTLDPEFQDEARNAVSTNLAQLERSHLALRRAAAGSNPLQSALVALDPRTGAILAMVGGRDYGKNQFNRATSAERQTGSVFKPVVYVTALDPSRSPLAEPLTLASVLPDRPMAFGGWMPADYERTYRGQVTVAEAIADSINVSTAYVASLLGAPAMIRTAHEMGIHENLPPVLPIALGAGDTTLLELTSVYQVFASGGLARPPYAIDSVVDGHGRLLYRHRPEATRALASDVAFLITGALSGVMQYGTGASAVRLGLRVPAVGKTGTTEDYHDAYFVGYTPRIVCGVWVGFDRPRSIGLTGAQAAMPAWISFINASAPSDPKPFHPPVGITMAMIDPTTGALATTACPLRERAPFLMGTEPTVPCPLHGGTLTNAPAVAGGAPVPSAAAGASAPMVANSVVPGQSSGGLLGSLGHLLGSLF